MARLEEIVKLLDDGRTDLDTALSRYEEGVGLLKSCHGLLENARRRVEILRNVGPDGLATTETVDESVFKTEAKINS